MQNSPKSHREANDTFFFGQVDKSLYLIFSQEKKKGLANSLYSFAYNLCKHTEEAQDLFQGSLERIISNQHNRALFEHTTQIIMQSEFKWIRGFVLLYIAINKKPARSFGLLSQRQRILYEIDKFEEVGA